MTATFKQPLLATQAPAAAAAAGPVGKQQQRLRTEDSTLSGYAKHHAARLLLAVGVGYAICWAQFSDVEVTQLIALVRGAAMSALELFRSGALVPPEAFFENLANMLSSCFYLSPLVQMVEVYRSRGASLGAVSPQTLVLMLINTALWATWGLFAPMYPAVPGNVFGLTMACCYLSICWAYALCGRSAHRARWGRAAGAGTAGALGLVPLAVFYAKSSPQHAQHVGYVAMLICILMFASPLSVLRQVVADRSSELLPPAQCLMQFMNCFVWIVVGVNTRALPVLVCNGLGCALGVVQLALILVFPARRGAKDAIVAEVVDSV